MYLIPLTHSCPTQVMTVELLIWLGRGGGKREPPYNNIYNHNHCVSFTVIAHTHTSFPYRTLTLNSTILSIAGMFVINYYCNNYY